MFHCECIINYSEDLLDKNKKRFDELMKILFQKTKETCFPNIDVFPIVFSFTDDKQRSFTLTITKTQSIITWTGFLSCAVINKSNFKGSVENNNSQVGNGGHIEITIDDIEDIFYHVNTYSSIKVSDKIDKLEIFRQMRVAKESGNSALYQQLQDKLHDN